MEVKLIYMILGLIMSIFSGFLTWQLKSFVKVVNDLKEIVNEIKTEIATQKEEVKFINKSCEIKHDSVNDRFVRLESRVRDIEQKNK